MCAPTENPCTASSELTDLPSDPPLPPDHEWLGLAQASVALSEPNPRVACRIQTRDGQVFTGHTQEAGGPHAEVVALRAAQQAGADLKGAHVWVSLEPCAHHGRTPPCCDALIRAQVGSVTVALVDPNPLVAGQGVERMRRAGIQVQVLPPDGEAARSVRELNIGFLSRMERGIPWVRMKMAASLDGVTALPNGQSQWITSEAARTDGHVWRKRAGAVLTGIGTVLEDDPMLDVRLVDTPRQPTLVIVDSRLETPPHARLFQALQSGQKRAIWIYHAVSDPAKEDALRTMGAELIHRPGTGGKVDLRALLQDLGDREVNELHVEAGHKLNGSLLREDLVDELLLYLAPIVLGQGAHLANIGPFDRVSQGLQLQFHSQERVGNDLRILVRRGKKLN